MKNIYEPIVLQEVIERINKLSPDSERQWGKMNVSQMLAHCTAALETAANKKTPPRMFVGRIFGPLVRPIYYNDKIYGKNSPTDKSFIIKDEKNFNIEKGKLIAILKEFSEGGEAKCTAHPHPFFGYITPLQWSKGMYKHMDHHLRQFNV